MLEENNRNHRSLSEILPKGRRTRAGSGIKINERPIEVPHYSENNSYKYLSTKKRHFGRWFFLLLVLIVAGVLLANHFSSLTVEINPKQVEVNIDNQFSASALPTELGLEFGTIKNLNISASRTLSSSGNELVTSKATGQVIIYNNYSSAKQVLVKGTRLATPSGRIFRLVSAVTVPGQTKQGAKTVPGSVEVKVEADQAGPAGNIALSDFTIPGFAGTAKATKFYARSKTVFTGGQSEQVAKIAEADKTKARTDLQAEVKKNLMAKVLTELPKGSTLLGDSIIITYREDLKQSASSSGQAVMTETGSLFGVFFDNGKLSSFLAKKYIDGYKDEPILIQNFDDLNFSLLNKTALDPTRLDKITFSLKGNARFVWVVDNIKLKHDLAGQNLKDYQKIFLSFSGISSAKVVGIRPFWLGSFPTNTERIHVAVVAPAGE